LIFRGLKIGIEEDDFWQMTPKRFFWHVEAFQWRMGQLGELIAMNTAHVMSSLSGKRIRPSRIYRGYSTWDEREETETAETRFIEVVEFMGAEAIEPTRDISGLDDT